MHLLRLQFTFMTSETLYSIYTIYAHTCHNTYFTFVIKYVVKHNILWSFYFVAFGGQGKKNVKKVPIKVKEHKRRITKGQKLYSQYTLQVEQYNMPISQGHYPWQKKKCIVLRSIAISLFHSSQSFFIKFFSIPNLPMAL